MKGKTKKGFPIKMRFSAGGLIYRIRNGCKEVALVMKRNANGEEIWTIPKGLIEKDEKIERTAFREVKEETGLVGEIKEKLGDIEYWYFSRDENTRIHKKVYFFLLVYLEGSTDEHDAEVDDVRWFTLDEAKAKLTHYNEKRILEKAKEILEKFE